MSGQSDRDILRVLSLIQRDVYLLCFANMNINYLSTRTNTNNNRRKQEHSQTNTDTEGRRQGHHNSLEPITVGP